MRFPPRLKESAEFDVVGFGTNAVDHLIRVPQYPVHSGKVHLSGYSQMAGGEVASTMAGLQRLGLNTAYVGRFGDDAAGELGRSSLVEEGVDIDSCEIVAGAATQVAFIIVDDESGERTIIWDRDERLAFTALEAPVDLMSRTKVLHISPHDVEACVAMATRAKKESVIVSIDIDNVFEGVEELLSLVDICVVSSEFPERLFGSHDHRYALREITTRFGCAVSGVTLGSAGSLFYSGEGFIETPGRRVPGGCVDTTGAGDAFRTGFLYGVLLGETVEYSATVANAVAALKCRAPGARSGLPVPDELDGFLRAE